ncbi:MAG: hypothetical protein NWQ21_01525 [Desulfobacterales bacterium]|nr:hypothetical protein [Desulfobacterales bacterium]
MKRLCIIALVVAITAVFAVSATANDWNLYGSARMATFYTSQDLGKDLELVSPNTFIAVDDRNSANQSTVKDLNWNLQTNSRIGATVTGDRLDARFEFSVTSDGAGGNVGTRRLYAIWKFTEGWGLKVGKDFTPITFFLSNQVFDNDSNLQFLGEAYGARRGQLAVEGQLGPGMLKVALIDQTTDTLNTPDGVVEKLLPKFEASYQYYFSDAMSAHAFGGYQTYSVKYPGEFGGTSDFSVDSWVVGAGADLNFGPFFVKPQVSYYQNGAAAGWLQNNYLPFSTSGFVSQINSVYGTDLQVVGSNNVLDAKNLMAMLAVGFKPTESLGLEAGVGYVGYETDSYQGVKIKNNYLEYYLQAVFTLAKGVYIIPEIGYRDFGTQDIDKPFYIVAPDVDLGSLFYAGAKWQIDL